MQTFFEAAVRNVFAHGDTDIFPFPFENVVLADQVADLLPILDAAYANAEAALAENAPQDIVSLIPVGATGFRIALQLDPVWNALFLAAVLSLAERIEAARLPADQVFSYRLDKHSYLDGNIFRREVGWPEFIRSSHDRAQKFDYVISCDVADCYARISHHKLENALLLINAPIEARNVIMRYLSYTTSTRSSGLPIGGPASRILAELALNNSDAYLRGTGIEFVRFADDYHIFCKSKQDAYRALISLSTALDNEGLTLQKSKTRIMTRAEFLVVNTTILANY